MSKGQSHCVKIISMTNEFARSPSDYQPMKRSSRRSLLAAGLFLRTTGTELRIRASRGPAAIPYYQSQSNSPEIGSAGQQILESRRGMMISGRHVKNQNTHACMYIYIELFVSVQKCECVSSSSSGGGRIEMRDRLFCSLLLSPPLPSFFLLKFVGESFVGFLEVGGAQATPDLPLDPLLSSRNLSRYVVYLPCTLKKHYYDS